MANVPGSLFSCRCCDRSNRGWCDGTFAHDPAGKWRRVGNVDGPDSICPDCQADFDCLEAFVSDGYEHACILIETKVEPSPQERAWDAWARA